MEDKNIIPSENNSSNQPEVQQELDQAADAVATDTEEIALNPDPAEERIEVEEITSEVDTTAVPAVLQEENNAQPAETSPSIEAPVYAYRWDYAEQSKHDKFKKKKKEARGLRNFAIIMSLAFVLSIAALVGVIFMGEYLPVGSGSVAGVNLDDLYESCYPSYTAISVVTETGGTSAGSGIIMTSDGFITTNYHVVEHAATITVILHDGEKVPAEYVDGDALNDIAVLKVAKRNLKAATIGHSSQARVGEQVMAIGTPYSISYRGTMTSGYISAVNRQYATKNDNGTVKKVITLLQTDTSVNPGNSGGPLFNMKGEVIGIVSMKIAGSQYEGLGFAIPIDGVMDMINDIIKNGKLTISNGGSAFEGAALGISGYSVTKDTEYLITGDYHYTVTPDENGEKVVNYINDYGLVIQIPLSDKNELAANGIVNYVLYTAPETGVRVIGTTEGFDSAKKLMVDDIILSANGISCEQMEALQDIIAGSRVGDKIDFVVFRNGKTIEVSVELGRSAAMQ